MSSWPARPVQGGVPAGRGVSQTNGSKTMPRLSPKQETALVAFAKQVARGKSPFAIVGTKHLPFPTLGVLRRLGLVGWKDSGYCLTKAGRAKVAELIRC